MHMNQELQVGYILYILDGMYWSNLNRRRRESQDHGYASVVISLQLRAIDVQCCMAQSWILVYYFGHEQHIILRWVSWYRQSNLAPWVCVYFAGRRHVMPAGMRYQRRTYSHENQIPNMLWRPLIGNNVTSIRETLERNKASKCIGSLDN